MSELALELIEKEKRERTGKLDLGNCGLTDFAKHLIEFIWLKEINLCTNKISDINFLKNMTSLKALNLWNNKINDICVLENLTALRSLDLRYNYINDIRYIENLINLESLVLRDNEIGSILFQENFLSLRTLDISCNQISDIRFLGTFKSLVSLDLSQNQIRNIQLEKGLTGLKTLVLSSNQISDIRFLDKLPSLQTLNFSENKIGSILLPETLFKLQSIDISRNQIKNIQFQGNLPSLQKLNLSFNQISDILFLEKLPGLQTLDLQHNKISAISFLGNLSSLIRLDLRSNQISDIQGLIPILKNGIPVNYEDYGGEGISLNKNPITNPPMNIVKQGADAILDWFDQIGEFGAEPFYESKLMILGQGGAGKTTFANLLLDPDYEVKPGKLDSTLGIVVHRGKEFLHTTENKPNIKAHLWDFGGQDIQKMLHQFFITENCLYVLVSDKRAENTNFDYWFQIINLLGPRSSVIVLENPKESNGSNEDFAINKYKNLYSELTIESIEVNLNATRDKDKTKWNLLNEMIAEKLSSMELVNRMVPKKWGLVRNELEVMKAKKYISIEEYCVLCAKPAIGFNTRQADWCLSYFRSLGELVYFDDRDLCTHIFLDHNWLTQGMYYILSDKKIKEDGGRFSEKQAYDKWEGEGYNKTEKAMLIKLLLKDKFDICYELPNEKNVFITPLLLPVDMPAQKWVYKTNLQFRYQYGFIPHGLFSRLIVQLHEKIDSEQHWKTGVRLKDRIDGKEVNAEVQQYNDPEENQPVIDIKISGNKNGCIQMLAFIRAAVEKLHKDFRNISAKQIVACNCETCTERMKRGEKPSFYEFEMLQEKVHNRNYFVDCKESKWKSVNIGQILNDIIIENAAVDNRDNSFLNRLKKMGMGKNQIINNINNQSTLTNTNTNTNTNINTITIDIQNIIGEVQSLKEDFEDERKLLQKSMNDDEIDVTIRDIEKAETALKEIEAAQKQGEQPAAKSTNRLKRFIDDLSAEKSTLHKGLKLLRKGKDYGVTLAETYNKIAPNIGLVSIPPLALEVIKKL